jgi:hypothetical protein
MAAWSLGLWLAPLLSLLVAHAEPPAVAAQAIYAGASPALPEHAAVN